MVPQGKIANEVDGELFDYLQNGIDPSVNVNASSAFISSASEKIRKITIGTGLRHIEIVIPDAEGEMTISEVLTLGKLPVDSK